MQGVSSGSQPWLLIRVSREHLNYPTPVLHPNQLNGNGGTQVPVLFSALPEILLGYQS